MKNPKNMRKKPCLFFLLILLFFLIMIWNRTIEYRTYLLNPTQNKLEYERIRNHMDVYRKNYLSDRSGDFFWGDISVRETKGLNFKKKSTYIVPYTYVRISDIPEYNTIKWPIFIGLVSFGTEENTEIKSITSKINELEVCVALNENTDITYPIPRGLQHTSSMKLDLHQMEFHQDREELYCEMRVSAYDDINPNELSKLKLECRGNAAVDKHIRKKDLFEFRMCLEKEYINNKQ